MSLIKTFVLTFPLFALVGCETYYKIPDKEPTAKVRFQSTGPTQSVMVTAFENDECRFGTWGGIMGVMGGINMDTLGNVPPHIKEKGNTKGIIGYNESIPIEPIERIIPADRKFFFSLLRIDAHSSPKYIKSCKLSMMFQPQAGREYEVDYYENSERCSAKVFVLESKGDGSVMRSPEPTFIEMEKQC